MRNMQFNRVFRRFKWVAIDVIDVPGWYVDGVWIEDETLAVTRTIPAIPLAMAPEDLELYSNGESSAAGITLITKDPLYWTDINAVAQTNIQTYATWQNYKFRVMGNNFMLGNVSSLSIYSLVRYIL